ncbi:unnamed protein product [Penicillium salamii]|uniref:Uncharacterized protein n=1 Tax=Penicillium salamii TaxID=1612424 RepID=A0A9W4J228_9EURO|nr:unnamed protein product [Penicillium salamii]CAG8010094.1 unnamed protein product [Penicillium salamii]CAG8023597.1 unnamed protein product [Penicillium salamii]CAG8064850.1 unnamed protein product [Penicillium salamii]CAG8081784.1 unnamed protein product [Penicillium salamii]
MPCLSITRVRYLLSTFIPRVLSPGNRRETVLFGGPDSNRSSILDSMKSDMPTMSKEQPILISSPSSGVPAKSPAPQRLHTVRIWFPHNGTTIMEDIKSKDLDDVVLDAIALQELSAMHRSQDDHGNTMDAFPADLAVLEAGISRVWGKYGIPKFVPLSSDDPIILEQPRKDLESKEGLCFQRLHSKYLYEYGRRQSLAKVLGYEMPVDLKNWYEDALQDIGKRLEKLGYC